MPFVVGGGGGGGGSLSMFTGFCSKFSFQTK